MNRFVRRKTLGLFSEFGRFFVPPGGRKGYFLPNG